MDVGHSAFVSNVMQSSYSAVFDVKELLHSFINRIHRVNMGPNQCLVSTDQGCFILYMCCVLPRIHSDQS